MALNIAEGKGRHSVKEFIQFLGSRGSLYETVTIITIFHRRAWISNEQLGDLESFAMGLAKQLNALIGKLKT